MFKWFANLFTKQRVSDAKHKEHKMDDDWERDAWDSELDDYEELDEDENYCPDCLEDWEFCICEDLDYDDDYYY